MIEARKAGFWGGSYHISIDGGYLTTFSPKAWSGGGRFALGGRQFELRSNVWGSTYALTTADGATVANAQRVGRKHWTVEAGGVRYQFQRVSVWRPDQALMAGGRQVGVVRRTSAWSGNAAADLPGLPREIQVFVVAVVLTLWRNQAAAAAAAS